MPSPLRVVLKHLFGTTATQFGSLSEKGGKSSDGVEINLYIYIYPQLPPLHCVHGCKHERRQLLTSIDTLGASLVSQMVNGEGNGLAAAAADGKIS